MPAKKLKLHIGHSKCGSTSIQRWLNANQDTLRDARIFIFGRELTSSIEGRVIGTANAYVANQGNWSAAIDRLKRLASEAPESAVFILSAEFMGRPAFVPFLQGLGDTFEIEVVHYIRNQADWCYSAWSQWQVKQGVDLQQWVDRCSEAINPNFWGVYRAFSKSKANLKSYDMRLLNRGFLHEGDLTRDFAHLIAPGLDGLVFDSARFNMGMDPAMLEVFKSSEFLFEGSRDNRLVDWVRKHFPPAVSEAKGRLSLEQTCQVMSAHAGQNERIRDSFFSDRKDDFNRVFGLDVHSQAALAEPAARKAGKTQAIDEAEQLRRALGYVIGAMWQGEVEHEKFKKSANRRIAELSARLARLESKKKKP